MNFGIDATALVFLRRIARALEKANELEEWRQQCEISPLRIGKPKPTVFSKGRRDSEVEE